MNFKVKRIKNPREFPYQKYTSKIGKHKFEANLYDYTRQIRVAC